MFPRPSVLRLVPAIVATTLVLAALSGQPAASVTVPLTIDGNADWVAHRHTLDIAPDGAFDFSFLADAPAGKHGSVRTTPDGHFEFSERPGQPVRFYGVNLTFTANFPKDAASARQLAGRLARSGYNAARLHHLERFLIRAGASSPADFDPDRIEQLDTLFAALKQAGLYISIDLYSNRTFTREELISFGLPADLPASAAQQQFKAVLPLSDAAFDSWTAYARALLTHRNPHTGLTWGKDPALMGICPVNEDTLAERLDLSPAIRARYRAAFAATHAVPASGSDTSGAAFNRFVHATAIRNDARMRDFIRSLGVTVPLTGSNYRNYQALTFVRDHYDYIDNHQYFDHPRFPGGSWSLPFAFRQTSAIAESAAVPRTLMPTRIFGRPFVVTEFNYVRPNRYRAEGGVIMPAYASLQDWDALFNFEYAWHRDLLLARGNNQTRGAFSLAADPVGLVADRLSALLFLRRDISPAPPAIAFSVDPEIAYRDIKYKFPDDFSRLGLVARIGSVASGHAAAGPGIDAIVTDTEAHPRFRLARQGVIPADSISDNNRRYRSSTGQIDLQPAQGTLVVNTPRAQLFALAPGTSGKGDVATVTNGETHAAVSVVSIDGKPLAESSRILITHLTDALPTGMVFGSSDRTVLQNWGRLPHLVRRGVADLRLRLPANAGWQLWQLDQTGARTASHPLDRDDDDILHARLSTVTPSGDTCLAYELARDILSTGIRNPDPQP
ncbi:hypothetical protein OpiT1DRAFT_03625 [Opitutaceae bacterium TAV1]|nr:hypothetical protein OpiT1DRAFT_03625 [Opitutaceae bacterium TAV1]